MFKKILPKIPIIFSLLLLPSILVVNPVQAGRRSDFNPDFTAEKGTTNLVYFHYGSNFFNAPIYDYDLQNMAATISLLNATDPNQPSPIELLPDGNADIFYGDPNRTDIEPIPDGPRNGACDANFGAPVYPIPSSFFGKHQMSNYGLQTAKNGATSSSTLKAGHSGCIKIRFKVSDSAKPADRANIVFDWDAGPSTNLGNEAQRPPQQIQPVTVGGANSSPSSASSVASFPNSSNIFSSSTSFGANFSSPNIPSTPSLPGFSSSSSAFSINQSSLASYSFSNNSSSFSRNGVGGSVSSSSSFGANSSRPSTVPRTGSADPDKIYLLKDSLVSYGIPKKYAKIYGTNHLTVYALADGDINQNPDAKIVSCQINFGHYGENNFTAKQGYINGGGMSCSASLSPQEQTTPKFDVKIRAVTQNGEIYGADHSYFFLYGAVAMLSGEIVQ